MVKGAVDWRAARAGDAELNWRQAANKTAALVKVELSILRRCRGLLGYGPMGVDLNVAESLLTMRMTCGRHHALYVSFSWRWVVLQYVVIASIALTSIGKRCKRQM